MHICRLSIKNFRGIGVTPLIVNFKTGLNIIVGENNVGKTTVAEAMALALGYGSSDRNAVQIQLHDFNDASLPVEIDIDFGGLSSEQEASFIEALDLSGTHPVLKFQFKWRAHDVKVLPEITCGQFGNTGKPYELLAHLNCHYLRALRDVSQEFKPGARNRIGKMLNKIFKYVGIEDRNRFLEIFRDAESKAVDFVPVKNAEEVTAGINSQNKSSSSAGNQTEGPIKKLQNDSNSLIDKLQFSGDNNSVLLGLHERDLTDILYTVVPRSLANGRGLALNGLGYNNLIYVAVLLTEIKEIIAPYEFVCLVVEEPEAHLHPQLQRLLLDFLRTEYKNVQVLITSHSPNFISDSEVDDLTILTRLPNGTPCGISIASLVLSHETKQFLRRFLDVTKAQLFFSRKLVLVEGYTEALLFRPFWESLCKQDSHRFHKSSIEVVNIGGIAFSHYLELIEKVFSITQTRCVVISDDDRGTGKNVDDNEKISSKRSVDELLASWPNAKPSARYEKLSQEVSDLKRRGCIIELYSARRTFEIEFALANVGAGVVTSKLQQENISPSLDKSTTNKEEIPGLRTALSLWKSTRNDKIAYALEILDALAKDQSELQAPAHFRKAFEFLTGNTNDDTSS